MTWQKWSRSIDWTRLSAIQKPSIWIFLGIGAVATVRHIAKLLHHPFNLPIRPLLFVVGTLLLALGWLLVQLLRPRTIALSSGTYVKKRLDVRNLVSTFARDADAFAGEYKQEHLANTIRTLLGSKAPASWNVSVPNRGELFAVLNEHATDLHAQDIQFAAKEFFNHQKKRTQIVLAIILGAGYACEGLSVMIMVYQLLG